jgi:hypothetical protein
VKTSIGSLAAALALVLAVSSTAAAATPAVMYAQFLNREQGAAEKVLTLVDNFMVDANAENSSGAAVHARQIVALAGREIAWLNSHQPARCYKNAWTYMRKGWTEFKKALQAANRWLIAYPYGSDADLATLTTYSNMGRASLVKADYYMVLTHC